MISIILGVLVCLLLGTTWWFYQGTVELRNMMRVDKAVHLSEKAEQDRTIRSVREEFSLLASNTSKVITDLRNELAKQVGRNKSIEVRTGQIMEKLVPFLEVFKYDTSNVSFLANPIDLIAWNDDEIVIIEVKTGQSKMTPKQRAIKKLIEEKKVRFELIRLNADTNKEENGE